MTAEQIAEVVRADLAAYEVAPPASGQTIGVARPNSEVRESIAYLSACLVTPYAQRFRLKDDGAQMRARAPESAVYWVIAESKPFLQFYDPEKREYGLAMQSRDGTLPETIGVRGDLLGVFGAM